MFEMRFPAEIIRHREGKDWVVKFPDLKGTNTSADTLDGALDEAADCLGSYLAMLMANRKPIPEPSAAKGKQRLIAVPLWIAPKVALYRALHEQGVSDSKLGATPGYKGNHRAPDPDPDRATKSARLEGALRAVGKRLLLAVDDAAQITAASVLNEDRRRNMKQLAQPPRHFLADTALPVKDFGCDPPGPKNRPEVFRLHGSFPHQFLQGIDRIRVSHRKAFLFVVLDEHCQKLQQRCLRGGPVFLVHDGSGSPKSASVFGTAPDCNGRKFGQQTRIPRLSSCRISSIARRFYGYIRHESSPSLHRPPGPRSRIEPPTGNCSRRR